MNADGRVSGGVAAQFREHSGGMNKMLKAQGRSPFQSCGRSYDDDAICGLETMTAVGNFLQDAIRAGSPKRRAVSNSFAGFQGECRRNVLRVMVHGPTYLVTRYSIASDRNLSLFLIVAGNFSN